jgi:ribosome biogenesis GTPase
MLHRSINEQDEVRLKTMSTTDCGVVYKKSNGMYFVHLNGQIVCCTLSARLRSEIESQARKYSRNADQHLRGDPIVVGDQVQFNVTPSGEGLITALSERRSKLARRSPVPMPTARPYEQVIVANVDQVVPVFSAAEPAPKWGMLDRYLVSAEAAELPALVIITKLDLVKNGNGLQDHELETAVEEYRRIGYPVLLVSALTGEGLEDVRQALQGRLSVFLGKSGVGKTSLLNALEPDLGLRVQAVSQVTGKGKHTTTHQEMFPLADGGAIVDTPGVREFGLWDVEGGEMALYFPELEPYLGRCRFGLDCRHDEEPGCAVRKAVMAGHISPRRWQSYLNLRAET